jgi:acetyl esterase/lipase
MRCVFLLSLLIPTLVVAQQPNYPPQFEDAREEVYKTIDGIELKLWVFEPQGLQPGDSRSSIVFFFGGGWKKGDPGQFEQHCRYLASRGMVAITADYRVLERHGTFADRSVHDAKSAIRFVRSQATRWGIDPNRIVAAGGSAGGHLAACTGVVVGFDEPGEDQTISSVPNAMALFNPALVLGPFQGVSLPAEKVAELSHRSGVPLERIAPVTYVRQGLPPMIIFHGTADDTVPFATVEKYAEVATAAGNRCEIVGYRDAAHGFFNFGRGGMPGEHYSRTVHSLDRFLASLGYVSGPPTMAIPDSENVHLRSRLDNSRLRFSNSGKGSVAFIGGSITEMNGYRPMVGQFLTQRFPNTEFKFTDAGIASTCSTTGAFRLSHDVLASNPDLLLVEFAVNDDQDAVHAARECRRGMEGILRQALKHNPAMDIVVTHFVNPPMLELLRNGQTPVSSAQHEAVATHYGVSTVNLAREVAERIDDGQLTWEIYGGTHPKPAGNRMAADLVVDLLSTAWSEPLDPSARPLPHRLPKSLDEHSYDSGRWVNVRDAQYDANWQVHVPDWSQLPGQSRSRFDETHLLSATTPGAELSLRFGGTAVGAYVLAGPDAGAVEVSVDGGEYRPIDLYHRFSSKLHYPRTVMFATDLDNQQHQLSLRVSAKHHPQSQGHAIRIMQFVAN